MGNGQYLNKPVNLTVNNVKVENREHSASNVGRKDDARASRGSTGARQSIEKFNVVASPQPRFCFFIVGNLFFVFFSGLRVDPIVHLKRAWT